jgi:hypothetical protein
MSLNCPDLGIHGVELLATRIVRGPLRIELRRTPLDCGAI